MIEDGVFRDGCGCIKAIEREIQLQQVIAGPVILSRQFDEVKTVLGPHYIFKSGVKHKLDIDGDEPFMLLEHLEHSFYGIDAPYVVVLNGVLLGVCG